MCLPKPPKVESYKPPPPPKLGLPEPLLEERGERSDENLKIKRKASGLDQLRLDRTSPAGDLDKRGSGLQLGG